MSTVRDDNVYGFSSIDVVHVRCINFVVNFNLIFTGKVIKLYLLKLVSGSSCSDTSRSVKH